MTRDQRDQEIAEGLIRIADRVSEALAAAEDYKDCDDLESVKQNLADINREVWRLRWEVGPDGGAYDPKLNGADEPAEGSVQP